MDKELLGDYGEIIATRYLLCHGYIILTTNFNQRLGEIDIIAEDQKYVCFVEVKTRSENAFYAPSDAVDAAKRERIIATSQMFLKDYDMVRQPRYDIIEVYFNGDEPERLNHIENAFDFYGK